MSITTIAVGVDGSEDARRSFEWAADLARAVDADLVVVHAVGLLEHGAHADLAWFDALDAAGVRLRHIVRDGNPAVTLQAVGQDAGADLLVVGSRGLGTSQLLGSTSTQLVHEATVPVVVIPR